MDETETQQALPSEQPAASIDLANRPQPEWLDDVEAEITDVDFVLKCLSRDSAKMCETCDSAKAQGELDARPMLARCASTKQPR